MAVGTPNIQAMNYVAVGAADTAIHAALGKCVLKRRRATATYQPLTGAQVSAVSPNEMWEVDLDILVDSEAASVNSIFEAALGGELAIKMRASTAAESAENPTYAGSITVHEYAPFGDSSSGEMRTFSVTYTGNGDITTTP